MGGLVPPSDAALAKLPKWARDRLHLLEANLEARTSELTATQDALSLTRAREFTPLEAPNGEAVRFSLTHQVHVTVTPEGKGLNIRTSGGALVIRPHVSNSASVEVES